MFYIALDKANWKAISLGICAALNKKISGRKPQTTARCFKKHVWPP